MIIKLIAGKLNNGTMCFWKIDENIKENINAFLNDYAIVENRENYALVKIVGIVETTEKNAHFFSQTSYEKMKSVRKLIPAINIEKNEE